MTSKEFEAYRTEVARLESEMRQSKERELKEVREIAAERNRRHADLKIESARFLREIGERSTDITNEAADRRMAVERREKDLRFQLQTQISMLKHDFECAVTGQPSEAVPFREGQVGKAAAL